MEYQEIYNLSKSFGPPKTDLRQGQILDDYGDESFAKLKVNHQTPCDVKRKEIDYYGWVYPFLEPTDLIFYLYPLLVEFKKDQEIDCFDSYVYSMDRNIIGLLKLLTTEQKKVIKMSFKLIWDLSDEKSVDWFSCPNLQKLVGLALK